MMRPGLALCCSTVVFALGAAFPMWTTLADESDGVVAVCGPKSRPLWRLLGEVPHLIEGAPLGFVLDFYFEDLVQLALLSLAASAFGIAVLLAGRARVARAQRAPLECAPEQASTSAVKQG
jgi:hypothetical protein